MKKSASPTKPAGMSDEAVRVKTGKSWPEWISVLDAAGAKKLTHQEITAWLAANHQVGPWWQQMVTVGYEQARGLREKHQTAKGYQISVSRTLPESVSTLYKAWGDKRMRVRWLLDTNFLVRKATADKRLLITWIDKKTNVGVYFIPKGPHKSQVVVQHDKLPNAKAAATMKTYWSAVLDRLKDYLNG